MITFHIQDMTCGHCASTITKALKEAAPDVLITIDLKQHRVSIETDSMTAAELQEVLVESGYTPVQMGAAAES